MDAAALVRLGETPARRTVIAVARHVLDLEAEPGNSDQVAKERRRRLEGETVRPVMPRKPAMSRDGRMVDQLLNLYPLVAECLGPCADHILLYFTVGSVAFARCSARHGSGKPSHATDAATRSPHS